MNRTLIEPLRAYELAYGSTDLEFTPTSAITLSDVTIAEQKYIIPVIGEPLRKAILEGAYAELLDDYIAPALAQYVRQVVDAPSAPASRAGIKRARALLQRLSHHLDHNQRLYPEYDPSANILKRCRINGYHIQVR